jgi:predicted neutral ceramidase superfamily lipid hydrolase
MYNSCRLTSFISKYGLWKGVVWAQSQMLFWFGAFYAIQGDDTYAPPSLVVLKDVLQPVGGLRTFGVIMAVMGMALLIAATVGGLFARRALFLSFIVFVILFFFVLAGWARTNIAPPGIVIWAYGAAASLWLSVWTPRSKTATGGRDGP